MALITKLEEISLEKITPHKEVNCTFSIVYENNKKYLQVDTYGSRDRQILDKKSQSLRFSPEALEQLRDILRKHFEK